MVQVSVKLDTIAKVKDFVNLLVGVSYDVDLVSGRYVVDAKSIMGLFSLDLSKAIEMQIHADEAECADLLEKVKPYLA